MTGQDELMAVLERLRAEARCANELERGHILWRVGRELGVAEEALLRQGFDAAYRRMMEQG